MAGIMRFSLSPQQRILFLVAALLVLFVIWIRLLARMGAGGRNVRAPGQRLQGGARNPARFSLFSRWKKYLASIMLGNAAYFLLYPYLPNAAQHRNLVDLGTLVDLWLCVVFYGLIELGAGLVRRRRP